MTRGSRGRARALLVKALYQWQLAGHTPEELRQQYSALAEFGRIDQAYFDELLQHSISDAARFDEEIVRFASRGVDQLDAVGRAILLLAMAEFAYRVDVPVKVIINEAVELAKRFGAADSYRFINAVLEKASKDLRGDAQQPAG